MNALDLLNSVTKRLNDTDVHYFFDLNDAIDSIGGQLICGNITPGSYLTTTEPFEDGEICDAVVYHYGDITYCYRIEEE